ncbi:Proline dehydrogenase / Delta-1-pyrroline-5-carboxylate dehydrogenase [hydrothermal vent metagenome]|uniref:L-glutamate gamma-semialdehyde dehydrogenase n=1 Tax=hydrothermal vent metagenome TaxID=652676 RepID=A0A3B1C435_9ZZZZ
MSQNSLELLTRKIGKEIFDKITHEAPGMWDALWWEQQTIQWLISDPEIKSRILRFIDVFPSLKSDRAIARGLVEYLPEKSARLPTSLRLGRAVAGSTFLTPTAAAVTTRLAVGKIASGFIAGETQDETAQAIRKIIDSGMKYTLDLLGEATLSEKEADDYAERYTKLIRHLAENKRPDDPEVNVSIKLSSLTPRFSPSAPEDSANEARRRAEPILKAAMETGAHVNIDMEQYELRDLTIYTFGQMLKDKEHFGWDGLGIVAQSYLKDAEKSLDSLVEMIRNSGRRVMVRLVKGAYWDHEVVEANQRHWSVPVHTLKAQTDAAYERMTDTLFTNIDILTPAIASHNIRSLAKAIAIARQMGISKDMYEIQTLRGMGNPIKKALVEMGIPVRVYAPFGAMIPGMAYLVRRMLENSSNESFLRRSFMDDEPIDEMLEDPVFLCGAAGAKSATPQEKKKEEEPENAVRVFVNEPEPAFHLEKTHDAMKMGIEDAEATLDKFYPLVIGGHGVNTSEIITSHDPAEPSRIIGETAKANEALGRAAIESARRAFGGWSKMKAMERFEILTRSAAIIRERKYELAALEMFEVGKTRKEALGDVNEAIDHIEFYARGAVKIAEGKTTESILGETNTALYRPRGAGVIIAPWNFPLAILAGMTCAAIAAGNTVALKPSSNSPIIAGVFVDILEQAGVPAGVVNFTPGSGEELAPALITNPDTKFVMFTGSFETGSSIIASVTGNADKKYGFTKILAEMGGKNAIIVDESADLDMAVAGVVASAFGFGGQKCSACSRVIIIKSVYESFVKRLIPAVESLIVGSPFDKETNFGPLIDEVAKRKVESYIAIGTEEAEPLLIPQEETGPGHFVRPAVFGNTPPDARIATEEIFGPVLSLIRAKNLNSAIEIANSSVYALTGGIYSRMPSSVKKIKEKMEVGNLYINRGITGAIVRRQPFGGFKRSGLGSAKAGSVELLKELSVPQSVSENIVRHGFSPDLES